MDCFCVLAARDILCNKYVDGRHLGAACDMDEEKFEIFVECCRLVDKMCEQLDAEMIFEDAELGLDDEELYLFIHLIVEELDLGTYGQTFHDLLSRGMQCQLVPRDGEYFTIRLVFSGVFTRKDPEPEQLSCEQLGHCLIADLEENPGELHGWDVVEGQYDKFYECCRHVDELYCKIGAEDLEMWIDRDYAIHIKTNCGKFNLDEQFALLEELADSGMQCSFGAYGDERLLLTFEIPGIWKPDEYPFD